MKQIYTKFVYGNHEVLNQECERLQDLFDDLQIFCMDSKESFIQEPVYAVITDDADTAGYCAHRNIPYLAILHQENAWISFPCGAFCVENIADITSSYVERIYQRFHKLPWNILETERLLVREIMVEDVPRLYELYKDADITQYMENLFADPAEEVEYTRHYIENVYYFYGYGMWVVVEKESGQIIGRAGVESKEGFDGLELGFMIGKSYQRKGYGFEVCRAILDYVQEELEVYTVCALVKEENMASIALCRKLDFMNAGKRVVQEMDEYGHMHDEEYVQMLWEK